MWVREAIQARLTEPRTGEERAGRVSLPRSLKADPVSTRTALFQRLSASRLFALGDRSGVLRAAQARSGRSFRLDVRQRVIVKALVSRHAGAGTTRGTALARHVSYLARSGAGAEGARPEFFDRTDDAVDSGAKTSAWTGDRHHFRFIISPEHGSRIADLKVYVRGVMGRVSADLGEPKLGWIGTCHFDTDQPHAHVLVRGRRADGRDLVIPRDYVGYGFRARAQETAQQLLGDLSRADAERRIWRDTEADRFTGFDRRLLQAADAGRRVDDGVGRNDAWAALSRGRLRHLERLGLATRIGRRYQLDGDLETRLRTLEIRKDVIRTLNQRRLEGTKALRELGSKRVHGRVVRAGSHDELGATPFVIVRAQDGVEHYARLAPGGCGPDVGRAIDLIRTERGAITVRQDSGLSSRGLS